MKIIASDYDGTLNHGGIDDKKRDAIKKWRKAGNLFGLVSGRGLADLVELPKRNSFECDFLLASNGAVAAKTDGTVLAESRCDAALAKPLLNFIFSLGCTWASTTALQLRFLTETAASQSCPEMNWVACF